MTCKRVLSPLVAARLHFGARMPGRDGLGPFFSFDSRVIRRIQVDLSESSDYKASWCATTMPSQQVRMST